MRKRTKPLDGAPGPDALGSAATLIRGLDILRAFTVADVSLGNQQLIERTGLPKATVSRLTYALTSLGYLHYDDELGRYSIGPATVSLGYAALSSNAVAQIAGPLMEDLAARSGAAVAIGMRDGLEMVYIGSRRSLSPVSLRLNVGARLPIWCTAMGLACLADMEADAREDLVGQIIRAEPARAAQIRALVDGAARHMAEHGFVGVFGSWYSYINAVGTCFHPTDGSPVVALTCGGIVDILPRETCLQATGPQLLALKAALGARLAGRPGAG